MAASWPRVAEVLQGEQTKKSKKSKEVKSNWHKKEWCYKIQKL